MNFRFLTADFRFGTWSNRSLVTRLRSEASAFARMLRRDESARQALSPTYGLNGTPVGGSAFQGRLGFDQPSPRLRPGKKAGKFPANPAFPAFDRLWGTFFYFVKNHCPRNTPKEQIDQSLVTSSPTIWFSRRAGVSRRALRAAPFRGRGASARAPRARGRGGIGPVTLQAHRSAASRINADELMQVVDFPHPRGVRFFSGRSGVFPSIGGGFELQKVKSSAWARLGSLKTAWARLARGCREMIIARKWGYGDASDPNRRQAKQTFQFTTPWNGASLRFGNGAHGVRRPTKEAFGETPKGTRETRVLVRL
jgi:hypothetical protein